MPQRKKQGKRRRQLSPSPSDQLDYDSDSNNNTKRMKLDSVDLNIVKQRITDEMKRAFDAGSKKMVNYFLDKNIKTGNYVYILLISNISIIYC